MPTQAQAQKIQAAFDEYVAKQPHNVFTSNLSDELLAEIEASVGKMKGPR